MVNPYITCYSCPKCGSRQNIGELVNFGTTDRDLDGKAVIDAFRLAFHSNVPQNILVLLNPELVCGSCLATIGADVTVADLFVKRP